MLMKIINLFLKLVYSTTEIKSQKESLKLIFQTNGRFFHFRLLDFDYKTLQHELKTSVIIKQYIFW